MYFNSKLDSNIHKLWIWLTITNSSELKSNYHIYWNKRPLPINCPPFFLALQSSNFGVLQSLSTANTFVILGFQKMMYFSTSQANIAYEK